MTPVERAILFAVSTSLAVGLVTFTIGHKPGAAHALPWEAAASSVAVALLIGLISDLPAWLRVPLGMSLAVVGDFAYGAALVLHDYPGIGPIMSDAATGMVLSAAVPLVDPPAALRRSSQSNGWLWPIYFLASAILLSLLLGACLLIEVIPRGQALPPALVFASFASTGASLLYIRYRLDSLRMSRPVILMLRPADDRAADKVVRQVSRALGSKFLLLVLELEPSARNLGRATGAWSGPCFSRSVIC